MMIKLKSTRGQEVLVNPDHISLIKQSSNHFGESYIEIWIGDHHVEVTDDIEDIEAKVGILSTVKKTNKPN